MGADRRNNFDALRLLAAASVVFSHSFLIAEGTQNNEPLRFDKTESNSYCIASI